ncbi:MAG: outer membrane beta-barrel protein [Candidatus Brocadia sp.]|nr:outer membrane beta-barrel protein [Candidatus Brocadia sp.]OQY97636.1 MAG: hypothetical protein B6D35_14485 [Candidatus Brocadia sp. UTAMX2]UJS20015.1 MAG: outer membrane beta-barrel protein [Candidatus Brocadia sp.]
MNNLVRYLKKVISIACLWIVICVTAFSSAYSSDDVDDNGLILSTTRFLDSLSYNYKGFEMQVAGVSIGEEYDDNVTFSKDDRKEDFITSLGLGLSAKYEGKLRSLELRGNIIGRIFSQNSDFTNLTEDLNVTFKNEFSRYSRMSVRNKFEHSDEPLFFREDYYTQQFGRGQGRFEYFQNDFYIDYARDVTKQLTLIAKYNNVIDLLSGQDYQDSLLNKAGVEAGYIFSSTTTSLFSYDFANRRFQDESHASIHTVTTGIKQFITEKLAFDGRTGLNYIDSFDNDHFTKPVFMTSLIYQKDTDTIARLSFEKKHETSRYEEDIFDNWRTTASVSRQLLERLRGSLSVFYGEGEYLILDTKNKLLGANSAFVYDIARNLKGNFTYTFTRSDDDPGTFYYTKNTVFFGLTAEF